MSNRVHENGVIAPPLRLCNPNALRGSMGFTDNPIINSPFDKPLWHYELDDEGQPTGKKLPNRRDSIQVVPVAAARRRGPRQRELELDDRVNTNVLVNEIRKHVDPFRGLASN